MGRDDLGVRYLVGTWQAAWLSSLGRRLSKRFKTKREAEEHYKKMIEKYEQDVQYRKIHGNPYKPRKTEPRERAKDLPEGMSDVESVQNGKLIKMVRIKVSAPNNRTRYISRVFNERTSRQEAIKNAQLAKEEFLRSVNEG